MLVYKLALTGITSLTDIVYDGNSSSSKKVCELKTSGGCDVWTAGESLGLLSLFGGEAIESGSHFRLGFGGAESNVAIGVSRMGFASRWTSSLGDDPIGRMIFRELAAEGVTVMSRFDSSRRTGLMIKVPSAGSERRVHYLRSGTPASTLAPLDVDEASIASSRVVHLTGVTPALSPSTRAFTEKVIGVAQAYSVPVSFDLNFRSALWSAEDAARFFNKILPKVSLVSGNPEEFALLIPEKLTLREMAERIQELGPPEVVVKNGELGAGVLDRDSWFELPAIQVEVVDTVGAGDAFMAAYLVEMISGSCIEVRLKAAVRAGARCCTHYGDWEYSLESPAPRHLSESVAP